MGLLSASGLKQATTQQGMLRRSGLLTAAAAAAAPATMPLTFASGLSPTAFTGIVKLAGTSAASFQGANGANTLLDVGWDAPTSRMSRASYIAQGIVGIEKYYDQVGTLNLNPNAGGVGGARPTLLSQTFAPDTVTPNVEMGPNRLLTFSGTPSFDMGNITAFMIVQPGSSYYEDPYVRFGGATDFIFGPSGGATANHGMKLNRNTPFADYRGTVVPPSRPCVVGFSSGPDGVRFCTNGIVEGPVAGSALTGVTVTGGRLGNSNGWHRDFGFYYLNRATSSAELASIATSLQACIPTVQLPKTKLLVIMGDSRTAGQGSFQSNKSFPYQLHNAGLLGDEWEVYNVGYTGGTTTQLYNWRGVIDAIKQRHPGMSKYVFMLNNFGINDTRAGQESQPIANIPLICQYAQGLGFSVISSTCCPDGSALGITNASHTTALNASIVSNNASFSNAFIDWAATSEGSNPSNSTYYTADLLHHTDTFYLFQATTALPVITGL